MTQLASSSLRGVIMMGVISQLLPIPNPPEELGSPCGRTNTALSF